MAPFAMLDATVEDESSEELDETFLGFTSSLCGRFRLPIWLRSGSVVVIFTLRFLLMIFFVFPFIDMTLCFHFSQLIIFVILNFSFTFAISWDMRILLQIPFVF